MERRPLAFRYLLGFPALALLVAGILVISAGGGGSSVAASRDSRAGAPTRASVRPIVEAEVSGALEAEGVGSGAAECAGKRVGAGTTAAQLVRMHRQPDYAWRWAWKEASECEHAWLAGRNPYA